jgi:large subunit ribosomal protein L15
VNLRQLAKVNGHVVNPETLFAAGLIGKRDAPVKLLGTGDADRAYTVQGVTLSASARTKLEAAGGTIEA